MFASKSLTEHLVRGLVALLSIAAAAYSVATSPWLAVPALGVALIAMRGCPTCWTIGLVETIAARARGRAPRPRCADGRCAPAARGEPAD